MVVLPPISTFDPRNMQNYVQESSELKAAFGPTTEVVELTDSFHAAQAGRGEILREQGGNHQVVDQETGQIWLEVPVPPVNKKGPPTGAMDEAIYALFESEAEVREALFFDEGHPDAEGFGVFAASVASAWERAVEGSTQRGSR